MILHKIKNLLKKILPGSIIRGMWLFIPVIKYGFGFLPPKISGLSYFKRFVLTLRYVYISHKIECVHHEEQIFSFVNGFLSLPPRIKGCIVEAGSYKGGSTAKFSIGTKLANRKLIVFDSFEGLPENKEAHKKSIFGRSINDWFHKGNYYASLNEVKQNVKRYGEIEVCEFVKGWFEKTLPKFNKPIAAIYLDVDLASSTKTCIKYFYPLLASGGILYSQDGDFPLVIKVFNDNKFWEKEVGCKKPHIEGIGTKKLIKIVKS